MDTADINTSISTLSTPREFIQWAVDRFEEAELWYGHGTDNALDEAAFLILRTLGFDFDADEAQLNKPLSDEQKASLLSRIRERITTRRPVAYILSEAWFAGLPFYVNQDVLIPRSPIAELITEEFRPWCDPARIKTVLDIGTGSGCIAIATALALPHVHVDAVDISPEALKVAARNIEHYKLADRITLIESDLFSALTGKTYDLIIANPPYVDARDRAELPAEYRFEPERGLYAGPDGLDYVRRILKAATRYLNPEGTLVVEVGNSQYALEDAYPEVPFLWLDFEHGGEGVFLFNLEELLRWFHQ